MDTYNLTREQQQILRAIAAAYTRNPEFEFSLSPNSDTLRQKDTDVASGVTAADLYALDDEQLIKRWKRDDGGHHCKPTQRGLDAVLTDFVKPAAAILTTFEPPAIAESIRRFRTDHPRPEKVAFLMMRFGRTRMHKVIAAAVRSTLAAYELGALRADDKEYHEDLYYNVATYMHGCSFGIAVFERLESDDFNPNVSLEVGYLRALRKPVCLLKDRTLNLLPSDLLGKLYCEFDAQRPTETIKRSLTGWLKDHGLLD